MRVIFMGTSDFALPIIKALFDSSHKIVAVYTKNNRDNKSRKNLDLPVYSFAKDKNLTIKTPNNFNDTKIIEDFLKLKADIVLVVAYGIILPKEIIYFNKFGCINVHPSLLPELRGASPLQRAIMLGYRKSGVSIIKMKEGIDNGDVLLQKSVDLNNNTTFSSLSKVTSYLSSKMILELFDDIHNFPPVKQDDNMATYATKISKSESKISWNTSCEEIKRKVNAEIKAYFNFKNSRVQIIECTTHDLEVNNDFYGKIVDDKFTISCKTGFLRPTLLKKEGKKIVTIKEFLNGINRSIKAEIVQ